MECKNCAKLLSEKDSYCNECGARVITHRLTLRYLFSEFYQSFFSIDANKPVLTFIDLFKKPETVIGGYINGVRKKYIHAFGYFTIAITFSSLFFFVFLKFFPELLDTAFNYRPNANVAEKELNKSIIQKVFEYQTFVFFAAIPIISLMSWLVFFNKKKYNYAENLIISLYAYSQASIVSILLYFITVWNATLFALAGFSALFIQIIYFSYVFKKLYKLTVMQLAIKTLYFLAILLVTYIILIILTFLVIAATGNIDMLGK